MFVSVLTSICICIYLVITVSRRCRHIPRSTPTSLRALTGGPMYFIHGRHQYYTKAPVLHQVTSITPRHQYYTKPAVLPQDTSAPTTTPISHQASCTPSKTTVLHQGTSITPRHQYCTKPAVHQNSIHGEEEAHRTPGWPSASFTLSRILILISSRLSPPHSQQQVGWWNWLIV